MASKLSVRLIIVLLVSGMASGSISAQSFLGISHSNMGGVNMLYLNPANIADARHKIHFTLIAPGFNVNNNYLSYNLPFPMTRLITGNVPDQYKKNGKVDWQEDWLKENLNGKPKDFNLSSELRGPAVMVKLTKGWSVALSTRAKIAVQATNVAEPIARIARYGLDSSQGNVIFNPPNQIQIGQTYGDNAFNINLNAYTEIAGTVAKVLIKRDNMLLKAGFTGKYLIGLATGYIKNDGIQVKVVNQDSVVFGRSSFEYGYVNPSFFKSINIGNMFSNPNGSGLGADIGATFEYSPDATSGITSKKNQYLFRAGASIMDIGSITYKQQGLKRVSVRNDNEKGWKIEDEFSEAWQEGVDRGLAYTDSLARTMFIVDTTAKEIKTVLPTTLNLQFDYNVFKMFYVGANITQDLRGKRAVGMRRQSSLTLLPRMETKLFEFAVPLSLANDYKAGRVGVFLRVSAFYFGSDNLIGTLKSSNFSGVDFYFGFSQGIGGKKKKKNVN